MKKYEFLELKFYDDHVKEHFNPKTTQEHYALVNKTIAYIMNKIVMLYLLCAVVGVFSALSIFSSTSLLIIVMGVVVSMWLFFYSSNLMTILVKLNNIKKENSKR